MIDRRRKTDPARHPFNDPIFGRATVGVTSMEFRRLFDQNIIRHAFGGAAPVSGGAAPAQPAPAASEASLDIAPPEGAGFIPVDQDTSTLTRIVGTHVTIANDDEVHSPENSYAIMKKIRVTEASPGALKVYWDMRSSDVGFQVRSKLYINGVAYGSEKTTSFATDQNQNQTYSVDLSEGDTIEIWGKADDSGIEIYVNDMRLQYSWSMTEINGHVINPAITVDDTTAIGTVNEDA